MGQYSSRLCVETIHFSSFEFELVIKLGASLGFGPFKKGVKKDNFRRKKAERGKTDTLEAAQSVNGNFVPETMRFFLYSLKQADASSNSNVFPPSNYGTQKLCSVTRRAIPTAQPTFSPFRSFKIRRKNYVKFADLLISGL